MATYTENYNLKKPGSDDFYNVEDSNENMNKIDAALKEILLSPKNVLANGIINGDFQVWQNGDTIFPSAANHAVLKGYTADMWQVYPEDSSLMVSKVAYNQVVAKQALRLARNVNSTNVAQYLWYDFTADESKKYIGRKLTISFSCRIGPAFAGTMSVKIINKKTSEAVLLNEAFSPQTTDQVFYFTTSAVAPADLEYLRVLFTYNSSTSTAVANDYFEITNVNFSATSFYIPFSPKGFADELRDCMGYYEKTFAYGVRPLDGGNVQITYVEGHEDPEIIEVPELVGVACSEVVTKDEFENSFLAVGNIPFKILKNNRPSLMFFNDTSSSPEDAGKWRLTCGDTSEPIYRKISYCAAPGGSTTLNGIRYWLTIAQLPDIMSSATTKIMPFAFSVYGSWVADARSANPLN